MLVVNGYLKQFHVAIATWEHNITSKEGWNTSVWLKDECLCWNWNLITFRFDDSNILISTDYVFESEYLDWFRITEFGHPEDNLSATDLKPLQPDDAFIAIDE